MIILLVPMIMAQEIIFLKFRYQSFPEIQRNVFHLNLFTDVVINSNNSDAAKLSYLKDSLSDELYYIVKNLNVSDGGFTLQIWKKLLDR